MLCLDKRYKTANTEKNYTLITSSDTLPFNVNISIEDARFWKNYMEENMGVTSGDLTIHKFRTDESGGRYEVAK